MNLLVGPVEYIYNDHRAPTHSEDGMRLAPGFQSILGGDLVSAINLKIGDWAEVRHYWFRGIKCDECNGYHHEMPYIFVFIQEPLDTVP